MNTDICEVCHERRATHFVCYGGTGKSSRLCGECFELSAPPGIPEFEAATRDAHCEYCGGQPCAGGTDIFALVTGVQKSKYMCIPCTTEYHRFVQQQLSRDDVGLSQAEQLTMVRKLLDGADVHMKKWVSERGSGF